MKKSTAVLHLDLIADRHKIYDFHYTFDVARLHYATAYSKLFTQLFFEMPTLTIVRKIYFIDWVKCHLF